jgi:hypothetical protein
MEPDLQITLKGLPEDMGLILSTTDDGQTYLHVPFRPETMPIL